MGTFTLEEREFHVYDLGGYKSVRVMWKDFLANNINALVFVIDASDANQFQEAKKELDVCTSAAFLRISNNCFSGTIGNCKSTNFNSWKQNR